MAVKAGDNLLEIFRFRKSIVIQECNDISGRPRDTEIALPRQAAVLPGNWQVTHVRAVRRSLKRTHESFGGVIL
jgi:hypothetical protein